MAYERSTSGVVACGRLARVAILQTVVAWGRGGGGLVAVHVVSRRVLRGDTVRQVRVRAARLSEEWALDVPVGTSWQCTHTVPNPVVSLVVI